MSYRLLVRSQAKQDLKRAAKYYEKQLSGLGRDFLDEVDKVLERVAQNPFLYQVIYREVRRAVCHKFPYGVFYRIDVDSIVVFAIVHLHRDVTSWRDRL